jgi:hypothetical protein
MSAPLRTRRNVNKEGDRSSAVVTEWGQQFAGIWGPLGMKKTATHFRRRCGRKAWPLVTVHKRVWLGFEGLVRCPFVTVQLSGCHAANLATGSMIVVRRCGVNTVLSFFQYSNNTVKYSLFWVSAAWN